MSQNASEILTKNNPANKTVEPKGNRRARVPMSVPLRKLEVPELAGYHLHWIAEANIGRALQAYYEFVEDREVPVNQRSPGTDTEVSGNTDLGSRISIAAGHGENGQPERLYLMKLEESLWLEDRAQIDARHASMMGSIFRGEKILGTERDKPGDEGMRYVDMERTKALFSRKRVAKQTT
jgi:hypothetical protein